MSAYYPTLPKCSSILGNSCCHLSRLWHSEWVWIRLVLLRCGFVWKLCQLSKSKCISWINQMKLQRLTKLKINFKVFHGDGIWYYGNFEKLVSRKELSNQNIFITNTTIGENIFWKMTWCLLALFISI